MSEALDDLNATGKRKRTRRHAAKVSALKKTKPATRQRETANPNKKTLSGWRGVRVGALMLGLCIICLLYTSPSPRDGLLSRMPSSA